MADLFFGYLVTLRGLFTFSDDRIPENVGIFLSKIHGFTLGKTATVAVTAVKT